MAAKEIVYTEQARNLILRGRDANGIGCDHEHIMRIVGRLWIQYRLHWRSPVQ